MTADDYIAMDALQVLETLCPMGEPVDGVQVDQDWDGSSTIIRFEDGTAIAVDGSIVLRWEDSEGTSYTAGDDVCAGEPGSTDYDEGTIISIDGDRAVVAWGGGACRTDTALSELRPGHEGAWYVDTDTGHSRA